MSFELGERVVFRTLHWEVEDNSSESIVRLFGRDKENQGRHVSAVVGLEPIERAIVPTVDWTLGQPGWDRLHWRALHHAYRLTLSQGRGSLTSADWGRLILEPYQLVPLQRIENLPYPRLLIADDTGLGKTAEAGLILFRLLQRRRADRVLVLTRARPEPERWRDEMKEKFGIDFSVINDGQDYARVRADVPAHLNVFGAVPRIVMSMYFAAQKHVVDDLRRDVRWDMVIIDEAHHVAQRGAKEKNLAELGRVVAERCEALLLLTATPHDGKAEAFASLLRLLDPYLVVDPDRLDPAIVRPLRVRRLKPNVIKSDGSRFLRRKINVLAVPPAKAENWLDRGVRGYCRQLRQRAKELKKQGGKSRSRAEGAGFLESFLRKRLASGAYACGESLRRRRGVLQGKADVVAAEVSTEDRNDRALLVAELELPSGKSELEVVEDLIARAERIPEGDETKAVALVRLLRQILDKPGERVVVFTEYVDTLNMLAGVLNKNGWQEADPGSDEVPDEIGAGLFYRYEGDTPRSRRESIRRRFLENPDVRILLATDAASESINLHKGCNNLIHFETVWNPNRYEQRNGRIDRYGQTVRPQVYLLMREGSLDEKVAEVGYQKLEEIADALGSVSNVLPLASAIDVDSFLEQFGDDQADEAAAELDRQLEAAKDRALEEEEEDGTLDLTRGETFDEEDMARVEAALASSREFVPAFEDVEEFLRVFFRTEGGKIALGANGDGIYAIDVPPHLQSEVDADHLPRATFRRDIAVAEEDREEDKRVEFLSPGHPLVRVALRRARGWVHQSGFNSRLDYRRIAGGEAPALLFTYAVRFLDGRGEAIEERFEVVAVGLEGRASQDVEADLRRFVDSGIGGNLTDPEAAALEDRFRPVFEQAREVAREEATRRADERCAAIADEQREIGEEALIRLGRWKQATEERLRRRAENEIPKRPQAAQLDLEGQVARELARLERERERRLRQFRAEQKRLLADEERRRHEIRAIEEVRVDSIDPVGGLVLVPEGMT